LISSIINQPNAESKSVSLVGFVRPSRVCIGTNLNDAFACCGRESLGNLRVVEICFISGNVL
jgi:hypothetical protein